jgi:hypothetical protein
MNDDRDLTILAITKMHGGVCTAGIDASGKWVRPVRRPDEQRTGHAGITDYSLLPIDFFHEGKSHLLNLGVTRFRFSEYLPDPPHVEDWVIGPRDKPRLLEKLSPAAQAEFLARYAESSLDSLDPYQTRSLGLYRVDRFAFTFRLNQSGDDVAVRASFRIGRRTIDDAGCTDLRMRALGRSLLARAAASHVELTDKDFRRRGKEDTYFAVGLSRLYLDRHWIIVVGVHSLPELDVEIDYARL